MNYKTDPLKIEITQDKIVDLLLHAATREDIAKLSNETKADNSLLRSEFKVAHEHLEARMDRQILKIDQRYNWIIGTILTVGIGLFTGIAKGFHWF